MSPLIYKTHINTTDDFYDPELRNAEFTWATSLLMEEI